MKKTEILTACLLGCICVFASATKIKAEGNTYTDSKSYTVTIPAEVTIDETTKSGSIDLAVSLETYSNLEVTLESQNGYKLVNEQNSNRALAYSIKETDKELVFSNEQTTSENNQESDQKYHIGVNLKETTNISGAYTDKLVFTLTGKNYTEDISNQRHKITFNTNDGSVYTESKWVKEKEKYGILPIPDDKDGYTFEGWYTEKENGTEVTKDTIMENADTTVYAHWKAHILTINYHNGGAEYIDWQNTQGVQDVSGQDISVFTQEKYGQEFSNGNMGLYDGWRWYKTGYGKARANWKMGIEGTQEYSCAEPFKMTEDCAAYLGVLKQLREGDVTVDLYPIWDPITYSITYNANYENPTGTTANSQHTYDVERKLTTNGFRREGYSFTGWNTKSDGTGIKYEDGAMVKNLTTTGNTIVTLYAQWKKNSDTESLSDSASKTKVSTQSKPTSTTEVTTESNTSCSDKLGDESSKESKNLSEQDSVEENHVEE